MHNTGAGAGEHSRERLESRLHEAGHTVRYQPLDGDDWAAALAEPADLVVVAGGDGTVAEVALRLVGRGPPLAIIPLGSANNISRSVGMDAVDGDPGAWDPGHVRRLDVGVVRTSCGERPFVEAVGAGVFADVLARAGTGGAAAGGRASLDEGRRLLRDVIGAARPVRYGITLDGRDLSGEYIAVEAMNIRELGPHLPLARDADPGDGRIDLVLVTDGRRSVLARLADAPDAERRALAGDLEVHRGRELEIHAAGDVRWHIDDELLDPGAADDAGGVAIRLEREGVAIVVPGGPVTPAPRARRPPPRAVPRPAP
jgi:diacylglycerol kinase (ATP)